jgi:hypothetical protein
MEITIFYLAFMLLLIFFVSLFYLSSSFIVIIFIMGPLIFFIWLLHQCFLWLTTRYDIRLIQKNRKYHTILITCHILYSNNQNTPANLEKFNIDTKKNIIKWGKMVRMRRNSPLPIIEWDEDKRNIEKTTALKCLYQ